MLIMMETGLMEHWRKKHLSNNNHCGGQIYGTVLSKLSFEDVKSVFLIWIIGLSIASAVFVLENVFFFAGRKMRYYSETRVVNKVSLSFNSSYK
jgi:beta-lactamase regulating signal transducer with metallopeptidase domain